MGDMCSSHEKMKIEKPAAFKMIWQSAAIVLLATAIGLLVNQVRPSRLTLVADWSTEAELAPESGESMVISLDEAQELFWSGAAVFLDARSSELYQHGHIAGARNLPGESVDEYCDAVLADIPQDALIITYCDGESCGLSKELALDLFYQGYRNVRVLVKGWNLWVEHQLPTDVLSFEGSSSQEGR